MVIQLPLEGVHLGTAHDSEEGCVGSQEDLQLDLLSAVAVRGSAGALPREYVTASPVPSWIELPIQHRIEEHVVPFLPGGMPQGYECIAAEDMDVKVSA